MLEEGAVHFHTWGLEFFWIFKNIHMLHKLTYRYLAKSVTYNYLFNYLFKNVQNPWISDDFY